MSYAILFKIYFIDDFVVRQLERLKARSGTGDIYVLADDTNGRVEPIPHDRVIRMTEDDLIARGFAKSDPEHPMFWHSADYSLYPVYEDLPPYDCYMTIEYDAVVNVELDDLVAEFTAQTLDFVGMRVNEPLSQWAWRPSFEDVYDVAMARVYLNAIALYSRRAVALLRDRRLEQSQWYNSGAVQSLPLSEAFIPTELEQKLYRIGDLRDFGDVSRYDWWPPTPEVELDELVNYPFIHPVLTDERCADSLLRYDRELLFQPNGVIAKRLSHLEPGIYIPWVYEILSSRPGREKRYYPVGYEESELFDLPDPSENIAHGKPATQSSVSPYSRNTTPRDDAAGAVNGFVTGTYGFHTSHDDPPWWMVDLEDIYVIDIIWIYNRLDVPSALDHIRILLSADGVEWTPALDHISDGNIGGAWGVPLIVDFDGGSIATRFVRVELGHDGYLHLDQVKIFGTLAS